jgi:hypothetical protein
MAGFAPPSEADMMARMRTVQRLLTFADLDDQDRNGCSVSVRHDVVLSDGCHVTLLDDRGWSSSQAADGTAIEQVTHNARMVVGPDEPAADKTRADAEADQWATLQRKLEDAGISTDSVDLKTLPHEVQLSDRLRGRLKA